MTSTKAKKKSPGTARNKRVRNAKRARRMKKKAVEGSSVPTERNTRGAARDALPPKSAMPTALPRLPTLPKLSNLELPSPLKAARKVAKKGARLVRKAARKAKAKVGARRAKRNAKKNAKRA